MDWFSNLPIRRKFTLVMALISTVVMALACAAFVVCASITLRSAMARDMAVLADVLSRNSTAALQFDDPSAAETTLSALRAEPHVVAACLYKDGTRVAAYVRPGARPDFPSRPGLAGAHFEGDYLALFRPVVLNEKRIGTIYVQTDLTGLRDLIRLYLGIAVFVLFSSCLLTLALSGRFQQGISKPILALANTARIISEKKDYSVRAEHRGRDEIGVLTEAFNSMLDRIHEREEALGQAHEQLARAHADLERKVAERTAALAQSNKDLEQFAYVASHDLQEPLRKVVAFGDLLSREDGSNLTPDGLDYVHRMKEATIRMQQLINDLLSFSRVSTQAKAFEAIDMDALLQDVLSDLEARIRDCGGTVTVGDLPKLEGDRIQMHQLFQNLIGNALKFHKQDVPPVVKVYRAAPAPADRKPAGPEVCQIVVEDNGIGFEEKYADRIFGIFQRLHTRSTYEGSGIGLAICRRIVERHEGTINVHSQPGVGSNFTVTLPVKHRSRP